MPIEMLTKTKVEKAITSRKRCKLYDGGGLILQITKRGSPSYVFRYSRAGKETALGLGSAHTLTLEEARGKARLQRLALIDGHAPTSISQRRVARNRTPTTFEDCWLRFWEGAEGQKGAKDSINKKSRTNRETRMAKVLLQFGKTRVELITQTDVLDVLKPEWAAKTISMRRLLRDIGYVFDWAIAHRLTRENPAQWRILKGALDPLGKRRKEQHHKSIPYRQIPAFMRTLREAESDTPALRALHFLILTGVRTGDITGQPKDDGREPTPPLRWDDICHDKWIIPRTKNDESHDVALSRQAMTLLRETPRLSERVFPINKNSMLDALKNLSPTTVHGFRSSFKTWAEKVWHAQALKDHVPHPNRVIEETLAHQKQAGDEVEAAYLAEDAFDHRRGLMQAWADYCESEPGQVIELPNRQVA